MNRTENIPKIKVEPKPTPGIGSDPQRTDKTVLVSDADRGINAGNSDTQTGFRMEALNEQYTILDKVGDGGMGVVYLAQDKKLGRYVAVKRLNRTGLSNPVLKERFLREARAVAALNHIHIVHVYGLGEDDEGPYMVMEYVPGPKEASPDKTPPRPFTLADKVELSGPFSLDSALDLLLKICRAIEYSHNCGVIHRDLKPSNVLLDESGEPKLADFGLARRMGQNDEHLTVPGEKMLSVGYGAPEQETDASQTDQRADVYGLGAILYFSITGKNPRYFRESEVPESLRMPIVKALETDRNRRWSTVKEFTTALLLIKSPSTIDTPTTIKTTWRCKWCDTVNPVTISYCGKCGWDGGETCTECGADTRVGIQFCGSCGADAREYEIANLLLKRMQRHWEEKAFELVIHEAGRSARFQPIGAKGRRLLNQIDQMGINAQKTLTRRRELKEGIDKEMSLQNYEIVQRYVEEFSTLSTDNSFGDLANELPSLILNGKLKRIRKAVDDGDWDYAERSSRDLIKANPNNSSEAEFLLRITKYQRARSRIISGAALGLLMLVIYILSAAPVYRYINHPAPAAFNSIYQFADFLHDSTILKEPLKRYARLWGAAGMHDRIHDKDLIANSSVNPRGADMNSLQSEHAFLLKKIEEEDSARIKTWQHNFASELTALQNEMQRKGDFEGWSAIRDELLRIEENPSMPDDAIITSIKELSVLQKKFRENEFKNIADKKKDTQSLMQSYIDKLENLQKRATMQGKMEEASAVNAEIKKIKAGVEADLSESKPTHSQSKDHSHK